MAEQIAEMPDLFLKLLFASRCEVTTTVTKRRTRRVRLFGRGVYNSEKIPKFSDSLFGFHAIFTFMPTPFFRRFRLSITGNGFEEFW